MKAQLAAAEAARRRREIIDAGQDADPVEPLRSIDMGTEMAAVAIGGDLEFSRLDVRFDQVEFCKRLSSDVAHESVDGGRECRKNVEVQAVSQTVVDVTLAGASAAEHGWPETPLERG